MRQQGILDSSWTETEAMRLVHRLDAAEPQPDCRALLERAMAEQVIPRLVNARRPAGIAAAPMAIHHVAGLVSTALHGSQDDVDEALDALLQSGMAFETVLLDVVSPAARRLGEMWEDDTSSFSDVTVGTLRLCRSVQGLGARAEQDRLPGASAPRALLAQAPGEQHGLGLTILVQFFRSAGWNVQQEMPRNGSELVTLVREQAFDLVGLSVSCDGGLDQLAADIARMRQSSRNPAIIVMVGGPPFTAHPQLSEMVGADATAMDAHQAVRQAHALLVSQVCDS